MSGRNNSNQAQMAKAVCAFRFSKIAVVNPHATAENAILVFAAVLPVTMSVKQLVMAGLPSQNWQSGFC